MSPMSDLLYSDTEEALRDSVRHLFADRCPPELVVRAYDLVPQDFSDVWPTLAADLGVTGLLLPEALRGAGASALAPVALLRAGATEPVSALPRGELTAALVVQLSAAPGDPLTGVSAGADGLSGQVGSVAGAGEADVLVVPVATPAGLELHIVSGTAAGGEVLP